MIPISSPPSPILQIHLYGLACAYIFSFTGDDEAEAALFRLKIYCSLEGATRDELASSAGATTCDDNQTRFYVAPSEIPVHDLPH